MNKVPVKLAHEKTEEILGMVGSPTIVISEIIKNSIDSNASTIDILIDTKDSCITIKDNGDGFYEEDIINLGNAGYSTKKSSPDNIQRNNGDFYAGNKGLGILSAFSLSDLVKIETTNKKQSFFISWEKAKGELTYTKAPKTTQCGTTFLIKNIKKEDIKVLTDKDEIAKLRHVTLSHFTNTNPININLFIDNKKNNDILCCNIDDLDTLFIYKVDFSFKSKENILEFSFKRANPPFKKGIKEIKTNELYKKLTIPLNNTINLEKLLNENFNLTKSIFAQKTSFNYLDANLEDFYGSFFIKKDKVPKELKTKYNDFLYGVRIFVNNFAMYSYLDPENDWLSLSRLSQTNKFTTLMLHNVLGYINFNKLNERTSALKITNERANFYEDASFKKLIEIVKFIIVNIIFAVDVAYRNNYVQYPENLINASDSSKDNESTSDSSKDNESTSDSSKDNESTSDSSKDNESTSDSSKDNESTSDSSKDNESTSDSSKDNESTSDSSKDNESTSDSSKDNESTSDSSKDNESTSDSSKDNESTSDSSKDNESTSDSSETQIKMKKNNTKFFNKSTILKSDIPLFIEHNELIEQLKKLNYSDFYLLYNIAFRSILEDISKRYLAALQINLCGDFSLNIKNMCDSMLEILKSKNKLSKEDKNKIELLFGGFNALKNYLEVTSSEFHNNNTPGIRSNQLNSITHTPRWTDIKNAEYIANNIIIPLYVLSEKIITSLNQ